MRIGVHRRGADAAGRAFAAQDERADAELREVRDQGGSIEDAGALLGDHHVAELRLELGPDGKMLGIAGSRAPLGRTYGGRPAGRTHVVVE